MQIRQPIVAVLGHVDSGKTSLLDNIRGTGVQGREAGGITQHIGASFLPMDAIRDSCGELYSKIRSENGIPGILVIDTPGHEVFTNLRTRGGSAADIAVVVVDASRGIQPQTTESLGILRNRKVPFVIALNKCDQISGWRETESLLASDAIKAQDASVQSDMEQKLYGVAGSLSVMGYKSEAFYRVKDFRSEVAIVPISAKTGMGIPELLSVIVGLTQQYLQKRLSQGEKDSRGIVLEVNDEVGLGHAANVILIDGSLRKDDRIVAARRDSTVTARPKALLLPKPLDEMRDPRDRFVAVSEVRAAAGVKIVSPDLESVLPGSTLYVVPKGDDACRFAGLIESEMKSVFIDMQTSGVTVKCDTIGSLEAVVEMLGRQSVPITKADIGAVNRRDVVEARAVRDRDRHLGVVLAFNVKTLADARDEAESSHVRIFSNRVIYSLIDDYTGWVREDTAHEDDAAFAEITPISKFTFMKGFAFRNSSPAVFGIRVDAGILKQKIPFMSADGRKVGTVHQLQADGKTVGSAKAGDEVACSVQDATVGRQVLEGDAYYALPTSREAKMLLSKYMYKLSPEQQQTLSEIVQIQRDRDPAYAY